MRLTQNLFSKVGKWSKQYANLPDRYIERTMNQVYWRNPKGPQYKPNTEIKRKKFHFGMHRPWTGQFWQENQPGKLHKKVFLEPIKEWSFFRGDRVQVLVGKDKGKQGKIVKLTYILAPTVAYWNIQLNSRVENPHMKVVEDVVLYNSFVHLIVEFLTHKDIYNYNTQNKTYYHLKKSQRSPNYLAAKYYTKLPDEINSLLNNILKQSSPMFSQQSILYHGIVKQIIEERNWVIVEGLNCKLEKIGESKTFQGMYIQAEQPLLVTTEISLVDPSDFKTTPIEWRYTEDGEKVRVSLRTGRIIPVPASMEETIDYKTKATYKEQPKDTVADDIAKITFEPALKTFEMDVMESMGIKEDRVPAKTYWY